MFRPASGLLPASRQLVSSIGRNRLLRSGRSEASASEYYEEGRPSLGHFGPVAVGRVASKTDSIDLIQSKKIAVFREMCPLEEKPQSGPKLGDDDRDEAVTKRAGQDRVEQRSEPNHRDQD